MDFILGVIIGVCGLFVIALHFSNKAAKAKPQQASVTPSALGLDMNGSGVSIETSIPTDLLKQVFRNLDRGIS